MLENDTKREAVSVTTRKISLVEAIRLADANYRRVDGLLAKEIERDAMSGRDSNRAAEQIRATITQSIMLELRDISTSRNAWSEVYAAIKRGIAQAANNIAEAIDEYGRDEK